MHYTLLAFIFLLALPGALPGQEPQAQDRRLDSFGEVIDVRVLNLEVAVTDKDGDHVAGLRPEDFRLIVDDELVRVEYFSEIRQGAAKASSGPDAVAAVPSVTPGEVVGTSFLLFIDNFFGQARDRRLVLREIVEGLAALGPRDRMAVVSFDGHRLDLVGNWSTSPQAIAEVLNAAMDQPAYGLQRRAEVTQFDAQLRSFNSGLIEEASRNTVSEYVSRLGRQVSTVLRAATTAMRTMASPPGRKVLLLTSGGWPVDPMTYAVGDQADIRILDRSLRFGPTEAFQDLASTANLLGYTIYPIDLPGRVYGGPTAADGGDRGVEVAAGTFGPVVETFGRTNAREGEVELHLLRLAEATGGRALINGQREVAMRRTLEDTGNYYWLGYSPSWERNDKQHQVRVEVLRPGLVSRSRQSFKDLSRRAEVTMMVESNLLFSTPLSEHSLEVTLGEPKKAGRRKIELPISLKIPLDDVVMLPVARGFEARLELRVAVMSADGDRSEIPVIPVTLGGGTEPPPGAYAIYDTSLKLRQTKQRLALALYDLAGERFLSTSVELDPKSI